MKRKEDEPKKGAPAYMNTYGDMMTLLLTFFVLMFSMSTVDSAKFKAFIESFQGSAGILDGGEIILNDSGMLGNGIQQFPVNQQMISAKDLENYQQNKELEGIKDNLEEFIYEEKIQEKVGVEHRGDAIIISFEDILLFETGKADLKPEAKEVLRTLGEGLLSYIDKGYKASLEGHTDNIPIRTSQFPSNWELSAARAIAVAKFFIAEMNFSPETVSAEGYGEYRPIATNDTSEGRAANRRVELKLTKDN